MHVTAGVDLNVDGAGLDICRLKCQLIAHTTKTGNAVNSLFGVCKSASDIFDALSIDNPRSRISFE